MVNRFKQREPVKGPIFPAHTQGAQIHYLKVTEHRDHQDSPYVYLDDHVNNRTFLIDTGATVNLIHKDSLTADELKQMKQGEEDQVKLMGFKESDRMEEQSGKESIKMNDAGSYSIGSIRLPVSYTHLTLPTTSRV